MSIRSTKKATLTIATVHEVAEAVVVTPYALMNSLSTKEVATTMSMITPRQRFLTANHTILEEVIQAIEEARDTWEETVEVDIAAPIEALIVDADHQEEEEVDLTTTPETSPITMLQVPRLKTMKKIERKLLLNRRRTRSSLVQS